MKRVCLKLGPDLKTLVRRQGRLRLVQNWDNSEVVGGNCAEPMKLAQKRPVQRKLVRVHLKRVQKKEVQSLREPTMACFEVPNSDGLLV